MTETVGDAVVKFRLENNLYLDEENTKVWLATLGNIIIPLPNFKWRRELVVIHDAHHLITGFPTTVEGELCVAAWELGVRCYSDWRARALCLILMVVGVLSKPQKVLKAFRSGCELAPKYRSYKKYGLLNMELASINKNFGFHRRQI